MKTFFSGEQLKILAKIPMLQYFTITTLCNGFYVLIYNYIVLVSAKHSVIENMFRLTRWFVEHQIQSATAATKLMVGSPKYGSAVYWLYITIRLVQRVLRAKILAMICCSYKDLATHFGEDWKWWSPGSSLHHW